jgi:hypothetical protein
VKTASHLFLTGLHRPFAEGALASKDQYPQSTLLSLPLIFDTETED